MLLTHPCLMCNQFTCVPFSSANLVLPMMETVVVNQDMAIGPLNLLKVFYYLATQANILLALVCVVTIFPDFNEVRRVHNILPCLSVCLSVIDFVFSFFFLLIFIFTREVPSSTPSHRKNIFGDFPVFWNFVVEVRSRHTAHFIISVTILIS